MSIDSMKRVLMATKAKARGMRKEKLMGRLNPAAPDEAPEEEPLTLGAEGSPEEEMAEPLPEAMAEGDAPEAVEGPPSEEEKAAAVEEIRALLARV